MAERVEQAILKFMKKETLVGHFESTVPEITGGTKLGRTEVVMALERLILKKQAEYRERGKRGRIVRYYYLREIREFCQKAWG